METRRTGGHAVAPAGTSGHAVPDRRHAPAAIGGGPAGAESVAVAAEGAERAGEYAARGDYHRKLDRRWRYYPIYVEKMRLVENYLANVPVGTKIIDMGCGEGILVEKLCGQGHDALGIDLNYRSQFVSCQNMLATELADGSVDLVLCLDVIEHLNFADQEKAIKEIRRILKPGGKFLVTVPNLGHFSSRLAFLLTGRLLRTSSIDRHPGDRPYAEYRKLFGQAFQIQKVRGLFPTFPISSLLTLAFPAGMLWWHRVLNTVAAVPSWCFLTAFVCEKPMEAANSLRTESARRAA